MSPSHPEETTWQSDESLSGITAVRDSRPHYDVYQERCPARMILDRLADKWALLVVHLLRGTPTRFNKLRRDIEGISQKALSQTLRRLERDGLVNREVIPTTPVSVEYSLTDLGHTLAEAVEPLTFWAVTHIDSVIEAQRRFDCPQPQIKAGYSKSR
ncbi:helix-turn-helix domain-containing protein [Paraburkholderia caribensis]|uniref:winged helix-turn-helix transcriptional regulator n=1 Tax=Paraburkholderia caribensis TaxID=75105 RepID=UPI0031D4DF76